MVSSNNQPHAFWIFSHSSYRLYGRGGGGGTPGLLDMWCMTSNRSSWPRSRCLHTWIHMSSSPRQKWDSSLKMTRCHAELLLGSLAWHHCSLRRCWCGVRGRHRYGLHACVPALCSCLPVVLELTGWLMEGITAHWMSIIMAVGSGMYSNKANPCLSHAGQTYPPSFIPVGCFQLFVQLFFDNDDCI